jgi:hypothetical protein
MGDTIWVDVRGRSREDVPPDNSIMLRLKDQLDRLSGKLNVAKLTDFYDYSELEAQYGDQGDNEDESEDGIGTDDAHQAKGSWFDAGQALAAVRALRDHLVQHPEALGFKPDRSRAHWPGYLMDELQDCQTVLEEAVARGRPFRFLIVP